MHVFIGGLWVSVRYYVVYNEVLKLFSRVVHGLVSFCEFSFV